jgi:hypothetical protein
VQATSRHPSGYRESHALGLIGYRERWLQGPWALWIGADAGGGVIVQSAIKHTAFSGVLAAGLAAGISYHLAPRIAIELELTAPIEALKRDGGYTGVLLPAGWFGISLGL